MNVTYHGHSIISVQLDDGTKLLFDPFITGNPLTDLDASTVEADYLLVTHGHHDHIGDMIPITIRNNATVISSVEICDYAQQQGVNKVHGMNIGGSYAFPFGRITFTPALHSSSLDVDGQRIYMGEAAGIILDVNGKTLYHAGDTAEFSDMSLIGDYHDIDITFLPIGDNYTMGPKAAIRAAKRIHAKKVVPIH